MVRAGGDVVGGLLIECSGECSEDGSDGGDGIDGGWWRWRWRGGGGDDGGGGEEAGFDEKPGERAGVCGQEDSSLLSHGEGCFVFRSPILLCKTVHSKLDLY